MEEKTLRDYLEEKAIDLIEKSNDMDPGTEKHSKVIEDVVKLCKAYGEDYKIETEIYNQNLRIEYDNKRNEEEIAVKKLQVNIDELKHRRVKADNIFMMAGFAALTAGACVYEITEGHIIPGKILQFANYIPKAIKL